MHNAPAITRSSVTLLHLSDPQFGRHHRFGTKEKFETLLRRLEEDLRGLRESKGLHPDLLTPFTSLTIIGAAMVLLLIQLGGRDRFQAFVRSVTGRPR